MILGGWCLIGWLVDCVYGFLWVLVYGIGSGCFVWWLRLGVRLCSLLIDCS